MDIKLEPRFKIELITKRNQHLYRVNDSVELYPGVTTVLNIISKPYLVPWAAKEAAKRIQDYLLANAVDRALTAPEIVDLVEQGRNAHVEKKEAAADLGTRAHQAINRIITQGDQFADAPELDEDIKLAVQAFLGWRAKSGIAMRVGDTKVASTIYGYGGSLDALGTKDGKLILVDFKTSNYWSDEYAYQVAAYAHAFQETFGTAVHEAVILKLGKTDPTFEVKKIKNIFSSFGIFLSALRLYKEKSTKQYEEVA